MGEYADDYIDGMIGDWRNIRPRRIRDLPYPKCRYCGEPNLRWQQIKGGQWCLHTKEGAIHSCEGFHSSPAAASDFPYLGDD